MMLLSSSPRLPETPVQPPSAHSDRHHHGVKELFASLRRLRSNGSSRYTSHSGSAAAKGLPLTPAPSPLPSPRPPSPPSPRESPPLQRPRRERQETVPYISYDNWTDAYHSGRLDFEQSSLPSPLGFMEECYMPPTPPSESLRPHSGISISSSSSRGSTSSMTSSYHFGPLTAEPRPYGLTSPIAEGRERFSMHLETVNEGQPLQQEASSEQLKWEMETLARSGRRPSIALSIESCSSSEVARSDVAPLVLRRSSIGPAGYTLATPFPYAIPPAISSCFDITTQQAAELLGLDFVALIALPYSSSYHTSSIHLLSHHNMPIPPPLFSISAHFDLLAQEAHAVAYSAPSPCPPTEFASGLIVKVKCSHTRDIGFLLVGYSYEARLHTLEELSCMEHFARDVRGNLEKL